MTKLKFFMTLVFAFVVVSAMWLALHHTIEQPVCFWVALYFISVTGSVAIDLLFRKNVK